MLWCTMECKRKRNLVDYGIVVLVTMKSIVIFIVLGRLLVMRWKRAQEMRTVAEEAFHQLSISFAGDLVSHVYESRSPEKS